MTGESRNFYSSFIFLIVSAFFSYALVWSSFFPSFSIALILAVLSILVISFKKPKTRYDYIWFGFSFVFAVFLTIRANEFLMFLNLWASFFSICVLALPRENLISFMNFVFSPFVVFVRTLKAKNKYSIARLFNRKLDTQVFNFYSIGGSVLLALIIIPLLSSANPIFKHLITETFGRFLKENIAIHFFRVVIFAIFAFFTPKLISSLNEQSGDVKVEKKEDEISSKLLLPKIVAIVILAVFFVTQIQLYFASPETLISLGLTNSQHAREVFGQLIVVSFIIGALVYSDRGVTKKHWLTTGILLIEGVFLSLIAFKSVNDYVLSWGLTQKRLWGYTGVIYMLGVYGLFTSTYIKRLTRQTVIKEIAIWSGMILLGVNLANFDYLIYNYSRPTTNNGIDYDYVEYNLSADGHFYRDLLGKVDFNKSVSNISFILYKIEFLQRKYKNIDWRSFNIGEYLEYKDIKDLDTNLYRKKQEQSVYVAPEATTCRTLGTGMVVDKDGKGYIGCDVWVDGSIDLSKSYCEGQKTHKKEFLIPDAYGRQNRYFATLTGLNRNEEVKVFVSTPTGSVIECLPSLNK